MFWVDKDDMQTEYEKYDHGYQKSLQNCLSLVIQILFKMCVSEHFLDKSSKHLIEFKIEDKINCLGISSQYISIL